MPSSKNKSLLRRLEDIKFTVDQDNEPSPVGIDLGSSSQPPRHYAAVNWDNEPSAVGIDGEGHPRNDAHPPPPTAQQDTEPLAPQAPERRDIVKLLSQEPSILGFLLKHLSRQDRILLTRVSKGMAKCLAEATVIYNAKTSRCYDGARNRIDGNPRPGVVLFRWEGHGLFPDEVSHIGGGNKHMFYIHPFYAMLRLANTARIIEFDKVNGLSLDWFRLTRLKDFPHLLRVRIFFCFPWTWDKLHIHSTFPKTMMGLVIGVDTKFDFDIYPWDGRHARGYDGVGEYGAIGKVERLFPFIRRNNSQLLNHGTHTSLWLLHMMTVERFSLRTIPTDRVRLSDYGTYVAKLLEHHRHSTTLPTFGPLISDNFDPKSKAAGIYECSGCLTRLHGYCFAKGQLKGNNPTPHGPTCGACLQDAKTALYINSLLTRHEVEGLMQWQQELLIRTQRDHYAGLSDAERCPQVEQKGGFDDAALHKVDSSSDTDSDLEEVPRGMSQPPSYPALRRTWSAQQCPSLAQIIQSVTGSNPLHGIHNLQWSPATAYDDHLLTQLNPRTVTKTDNIPIINPPIHLAHLAGWSFANIPAKQPSSRPEPSGSSPPAYTQSKDGPRKIPLVGDFDKDDF